MSAYMPTSADIAVICVCAIIFIVYWLSWGGGDDDNDR